MKQYAPGKEPQYDREESKLHPEEIEVQGGVLGWLDNFWFYHKWKVIVISICVLLFIFFAAQMCGEMEDDLTILYAGSAYLTTSENYHGILDAFESVMPSDYNGDGQKKAAFAAMNIYSKEQIQERLEKISAGENLSPINTAINTNEYNSFHLMMQTGEYSICLIEEWLYKEVNPGVFRKLEEVLGYIPENAVDSYAVYFWDTDFAKANAEAFAAVPKETLLCLRVANSMTGKGSKEQYRRSEETFIEIFKIKYEEETNGDITQ